MSHKLILEKIKTLPEHYQQLFEKWRIFMGMENAYYRIMQDIRMDKELCMGG